VECSWECFIAAAIEKEINVRADTSLHKGFFNKHDILVTSIYLALYSPFLENTVIILFNIFLHIFENNRLHNLCFFRLWCVVLIRPCTLIRL